MCFFPQQRPVEMPALMPENPAVRSSAVLWKLDPSEANLRGIKVALPVTTVKGVAQPVRFSYNDNPSGVTMAPLAAARFQPALQSYIDQVYGHNFDVLHVVTCFVDTFTFKVDLDVLPQAPRDLR